MPPGDPLTIITASDLQRSHYSEEDPLGAINYRVSRAVRAEEAAARVRQLAERPPSPRAVRTGTVSSRHPTT